MEIQSTKGSILIAIFRNDEDFKKETPDKVFVFKKVGIKNGKRLFNLNGRKDVVVLLCLMMKMMMEK
jgi:hypothetical protein